MKHKLTELNEDELYMFVSLAKIEKENVEGLFIGLSNEPGGWVLKAIEKRFQVLEIKVDKKVLIMILSHGDGAVGRCANYVDNIHEWCQKNEKKEVSWEDYSMNIYPHGVPNF